MPDQADFFALRFSIVEESQAAIDVFAIPSRKGDAVVPALRNEDEFHHNNVRYTFVGFGAPNDELEAGRFLLGKMAKFRRAHVGAKVPGDIVERVEDDWLPIYLVVDLERQYILAEKDWRVGTSTQVAKAIQAGLNRVVLPRFNHRVFVEGVTRTEHFWKVVREHSRIYRLDINLVSPNILQTNVRAREALAALKELFGQDEISMRLKNQSGLLKVPDQPTSDYIEYAARGEGSWKVVTEGGRGGKKTHSSLESTDVVTLTTPATEGEDRKSFTAAFTQQPLLENLEPTQVRSLISEAADAIERLGEDK